MSNPAGSSSGPPGPLTPWQNRLQDHCRLSQMNPPAFTIVSDRRGGRTAWSCIVVVEGREISARFWYDGQNLNNAKEDAAEVALQRLQVIPTPASPQAYRGQQHGVIP